VLAYPLNKYGVLLGNLPEATYPKEEAIVMIASSHL